MNQARPTRSNCGRWNGQYSWMALAGLSEAVQVTTLIFIVHLHILIFSYIFVHIVIWSLWGSTGAHHLVFLATLFIKFKFGFLLSELDFEKYLPPRTEYQLPHFSHWLPFSSYIYIFYIFVQIHTFTYSYIFVHIRTFTYFIFSYIFVHIVIFQPRKSQA